MRVVNRFIVPKGAPAPPQSPRTTRLVLTSDTHALWRGEGAPAGDIFVHAGDFSRTGTFKEVQLFGAALRLLRHPHIVVVAGNHEKSFDPTRREFSVECMRELSTTPRVTYLENDGARVAGVKIWGSPATPPFYDWGWMRTDEERRELWNLIPDDTDVLVTHGPPFGIGDRCAHGGRVGCKFLRERVDVVSPPLHVFGHIHESFGFYSTPKTLFANASMCTLRYTPTNPFLVVDVIVC